MKLQKYLFIAISLFANLIVLAQTPFSCDGTFYISLYETGAVTVLNEVKVAQNGNAVFTPLSPNMPYRINSIGYRVTDNFIYGLHPSNDRVYRVDATGTAIEIGMTSLTNNNNYVAGDVSPDGNYLVVIGKNQNNPSSELVKIDLNSPTLAATITPLTDATTGLVNSTTKIADIAFSPVSGELYAYDSPNKKLVKIDFATGAIDTSLYAPTSANGIGAVFFDSFGQLWAYGRVSSATQQQDLFSIDLTTGATTYVATGSATNGNDGCSCPYTIDLAKRIDLMTVQQCETFDIVYPISNLTGTIQTGIDLEDVLPSGFTIQQIISNPFGGIISGIGSNQISVDGLTLQLGVDSLVIRVSSPSSSTGFFSSHAQLSNLPAFLGSSILSDNPKTFQTDDETGINVTTNINAQNSFEILGNDTTFCENGLLVLDATASNITDYLWQDNSINATLDVTTGGAYWVQVTDINGCNYRDTISVDTKDCMCDIQMPNVFTPNSDGENDTFQPLFNPSCSFNNYQFQVFNRWGNLVFSTTNPTENWNAVYKGKIQPQDSYIWSISYRDANNEIIKKKGSVLLIR